MANVVNSINKKYVYISNRVTEAYTAKYGLPCDLYFPIFDNYKTNTKYRDMKLFAPHQSPTYLDKPDVEKTLFYIPYLIKDDAMNSSEREFDSFYTETEIDRPFIETSKKRELPLQTKVVVYQGESISKFFVDKKLVVTGASGIMLLRMYLSPLAKDNDEEQIEQIETETEGENLAPVQYTPFVVEEDSKCVIFNVKDGNHTSPFLVKNDGNQDINIDINTQASMNTANSPTNATIYGNMIIPDEDD